MARPSLTLVERTTRLVLSGQDGLGGCAGCPRGHYKKLRQVPRLAADTLTDDRRKEMTEHDRGLSGSPSGSSLPIREGLCHLPHPAIEVVSISGC